MLLLFLALAAVTAASDVQTCSQSLQRRQHAHFGLPQELHPFMRKVARVVKRDVSATSTTAVTAATSTNATRHSPTLLDEVESALNPGNRLFPAAIACIVLASILALLALVCVFRACRSSRSRHGKLVLPSAIGFHEPPRGVRSASDASFGTKKEMSELEFDEFAATFSAGKRRSAGRSRPSSSAILARLPRSSTPTRDIASPHMSLEVDKQHRASASTSSPSGQQLPSYTLHGQDLPRVLYQTPPESPSTRPRVPVPYIDSPRKGSTSKETLDDKVDMEDSEGIDISSLTSSDEGESDLKSVDVFRAI